ncbi:hypothetical protein THAOC_37576 [Thalassiosira oceanica]|uniref:Uncharacterized protein n=1 Tax=Thalassiosira oceanica TaxID=159749 RepID=K0QYL8_THAOC|nr:hypothetical protein THAOC_37576 [Thalassiosira oceanica]|eukprot:EJK43935.1 hypothetical protein THAOC_37576 [Thalassiosira oceanica]
MPVPPRSWHDVADPYAKSMQMVERRVQVVRNRNNAEEAKVERSIRALVDKKNKDDNERLIKAKNAGSGGLDGMDEDDDDDSNEDDESNSEEKLNNRNHDSAVPFGAGEMSAEISCATAGFTATADLRLRHCNVWVVLRLDQWSDGLLRLSLSFRFPPLGRSSVLCSRALAPYRSQLGEICAGRGTKTGASSSTHGQTYRGRALLVALHRESRPKSRATTMIIRRVLILLSVAGGGVESFGFSGTPTFGDRAKIRKRSITRSINGRDVPGLISRRVCRGAPSAECQRRSIHGGASALRSSPLASLHGSQSFVTTVLLAASSLGMALERKTQWGKALSANLVTMLASLVLANVGVIPFSSPVYSFVNKVLVSLAVGAVSTIVGTLSAVALVDLSSLGENGWKVASALNARHIGGAINFVAVADTLGVDGSIVSAAIAADNVVVALYFTLLFYLAVAGEESKKGSSATDRNLVDLGSKNALDDEIEIPPEDDDGGENEVTATTIAYSLTTASMLVTLGSILTAALYPGLSDIVLTSMLTVVAATIYPRWFRDLRKSGVAIGVLFLQMFFAASGAGGSLLLVLRRAPSLVAFSLVQLAVHFACIMGIGRAVMRLDPNELYLASNANVGGPTTAAAMAQAKNWKKKYCPPFSWAFLATRRPLH